MDDFDDDLPTGAATEREGNDPVERFMGDSIAMIEPTASLRAAAERLHSAEVGLIVVGTAEAVKGVVSERDIVRAVAHGVDLDNTTVENIESEDLKWATRGTSVADVIEEMMEHYLRHVLIAGDDGQLVGVASMRELVAAYLD